jgi:hypothetical protein
MSDIKKVYILLFNKNCEGIKWTKGFLFKLRIKRVVKEKDILIRVTTLMWLKDIFI